MNILKRAYCRIFQFCFKIAIPLLPYYNPKILDKIEDISDVLFSKGKRNVLLVTDKSIRNLGITNNLEKHLVDNGINVVVFDDVISNPTVENVEQARELYLQNKCEALIGFGESGMGSYHGKFGFDTFSHKKSILDKKTWFDLPMRYQPYNKLYDKLLKLFLK